MKMAKFKSSLLITTLVSTSLFGSKPDLGKLQLQPQSKKATTQTIVCEEFLPPCTKKEMNLFNASPEVLALKEEYDLLQQKKEDIRKQYLKALEDRQHAKQDILKKATTKKTIIKREIDKSIVYDSMNKYETLFKTQLISAIKDQGLSEGLSDLFYKLFLASYVRCSFFELIQYPITNELLAKWQTTSMRFLQEIPEKELTDSLSIYGSIVPTNSCIAMLQEGYIELLKKYKELSGNAYFYWYARTVLANQNYEESMKNLIRLHNECEKFSIEHKNAEKNELTELIKIFKDNNIELPNEISIETAYSVLLDKAKKDEAFKIKLKTNDTLRKVVFEKKEVEDEYIRKMKEKKALHELIKKAKIETTKTHEEYDRARAEYHAKIKKQLPQTKTFVKKQAPKYGRKAARSAQPIPAQVSQKQMQQAQKPKTLEDLNAKFGEELEKVFDKLEAITINFKSEDGWNMFIEEANVEFFGVSYRHGSHESEEIYFDFEQEKDNGEIEKQRIKGQLLTYHIHGKDTLEETTRQIRVTRYTQK